MSATITISSSEIREILQPHTSSASWLWELAQKANTLAVIIGARWAKIPIEYSPNILRYEIDKSIINTSLSQQPTQES